MPLDKLYTRSAYIRLGGTNMPKFNLYSSSSWLRLCCVERIVFIQASHNTKCCVHKYNCSYKPYVFSFTVLSQVGYVCISSILQDILFSPKMFKDANSIIFGVLVESLNDNIKIHPCQ